MAVFTPTLQPCLHSSLAASSRLHPHMQNSALEGTAHKALYPQLLSFSLTHSLPNLMSLSPITSQAAMLFTSVRIPFWQSGANMAQTISK